MSVLDRIPRDRTKREHLAAIDKVIWCDDDRPVSIIALNDGKTVVVNEKSTRFYRHLRRRWQQDGGEAVREIRTGYCRHPPRAS